MKRTQRIPILKTTYLFRTIFYFQNIKSRMASAPTVSVAQGQLRGRVVTNPIGITFYSFQGIPYAKPPIGALRFKVSFLYY